MTAAVANLISIPGLEGSKLAGKAVWGAFRGDLDLAALEKEWAARGLAAELLPNRPTAEKALKKAMLKVKRNARELIRPLGGGVKGYALVQETVQGEDLDYDTDGKLIAKVGWTDIGTDAATECAVVTPEDDPRAEEIRSLFDEYRNRLTARDQIGPWIWNKLAVHHCDAVSLRETGGVYFIPPSGLGEFDTFSAVLREVSDSKVVGIPAVECDDAVEAVLEGVQAEARKLIKETEDDLAKSGDTALGERALNTRKSNAEAMRAKLGRYEKLLGAALPDIHTQLTDLDADIVGAVLLAGGNDDDFV